MPIQPHTAAFLTALVLGASSLSALAQPNMQPGRPGNGPAPHLQSAPPAPQFQAPRGAGPAAAPAHVQPRQPMPPAHAQQRHGAGPDHQWVKGSRVPAQFRTPHYVVQDWRGHGLKQPSRGQRWVQHGHDYLLLNSSGVVAQIVFGR